MGGKLGRPHVKSWVFTNVNRLQVALAVREDSGGGRGFCRAAGTEPPMMVPYKHADMPLCAALSAIDIPARSEPRGLDKIV